MLNHNSEVPEHCLTPWPYRPYNGDPNQSRDRSGVELHVPLIPEPMVANPMDPWIHGLCHEGSNTCPGQELEIGILHRAMTNPAGHG